jgi:hypothetical protein
MSRRRPPALLREAVAAIGERGHAVDVDTHAGHVKVSWTSDDGRHQLFVFSRAPRDHRADRNARSTLRRLLAQEVRS